MARNRILSGPWDTGSVRCAVCDAGIDSKLGVVAQILNVLQSGQGFSVGSVESFWRDYRDDLCYDCQNKLDSLDGVKRQAVQLLEEAVRLDPSNDAARKNLEVARRL